MAEMILVVDDETEIAELVEVYLKNEGYLVKKGFLCRRGSAYCRHPAHCTGTAGRDASGSGRLHPLPENSGKAFVSVDYADCQNGRCG